MICTIISSHQDQQFSAVTAITVPTMRGSMEILPGHAESFIVLSPGEVAVVAGETTTVPITTGVCTIRDDVVVITQ